MKVSRKKAILLLFTICGLLPFLMGISRRPAVEPVMGIAIENSSKPPTNAFVGYDFSSGRPKDLRPESYQLASKLKGEEGAGGLSPAYFIFFLAFLPMAIWFTVMKKIPQEGPESLTNAVDFLEYQQRRQKLAQEKEPKTGERKVSKAS